MELENPSKEQLELIYGEFQATPDAVQRDVRILIEWLGKQPHLPNVTDEEFLTHCILRCKNSMERVKLILERYYSLKTLMPDVYDNRDPTDPNVVLCMRVIAFIPLPKLSEDGCRVSILRVLEPMQYDRVRPDDVIKSIIMSADLRLRIDACRSDILIFDMRDFMMPIVSLVMANLRKFIISGTKGGPMRQKLCYIINASSSVESLIMMAKSFLRKDLVRKVVVLKTQDELINVLPKQLLPKDYGGESRPFTELNELWIQTMQSYRDWFKEQDSVKADNSKRLTREDSKLGDLPLDGSFRKIAID